MDILSDDAIAQQLTTLDMAWTAIGNDYLVRSFTTHDFNEGVALVNKIAEVANRLGHHPDITLTYQRVEVRSSTHDVAGITTTDFQLASEIDKTIS